MAEDRNKFLTRLEFSLKTKFVVGKINAGRGDNCINVLKKGQFDCIQSILQNDTIGVLPTGYGKSLVFEALPYFCEGKAVLIISPLNSIISEFLMRQGNKAVRVCDVFLKAYRSDSAPMDHVLYFIGHPEDFIKKETFQLLRRTEWQSKISHIVVDEAHCVVQWGIGFREKFLELKFLRSMFPDAKVLALTATATLKMQSEIAQNLAMLGHKTVTASLDRPNIKIELRRRLPNSGKNTTEESYDSIFKPLIQELRGRKEKFPKTIIYTKLKWCGYGTESAVRPPNEDFVDLQLDSKMEEFVRQYHSPCTQQMRDQVLKEMGNTDSSVRLLFATEAYSMGTDAPDVRRIVHAGVPTSLEIYIQEIGRAGRDGQPAVATMHYNKSDISAGVKGMSDEMREFCLSDLCRREFLCKTFGFQTDHIFDIAHDCCDICQKRCSCGDCTVSQVETESESTTEEKVQVQDLALVRMIHSALTDYFHAENDLLDVPNACLYTGLTSKLAQTVANNYSLYTGCQMFIQKHPAVKPAIAQNILSLLNEILVLYDH